MITEKEILMEWKLPYLNSTLGTMDTGANQILSRNADFRITSPHTVRKYTRGRSLLGCSDNSKGGLTFVYILTILGKSARQRGAHGDFWKDATVTLFEDLTVGVEGLLAVPPQEHFDIGFKQSRGLVPYEQMYDYFTDEITKESLYKQTRKLYRGNLSFHDMSR